MTLKKGDLVVMHTCGEATYPKYNGKIWTCKTDEYVQGKGVYKQNLIFLEGFSGSFATEFLQKVDISECTAEIDRLRKTLESVQKLLQEGKYGCYDMALNAASQALEPAKGEDNQ